MEILLDHVVHYVEDPWEAMKSFRKSGFHTTNGGNHESWGTYNTLSYFKNLAYIEWIGIKHLDVTRASNHPFSQHLLADYKYGEGLSHIAFRTSSIKDVQLELTHKGIKTIGPFPGSRKRPDGTLLKWSMLFIEHTSTMPFFIEWGDEDTTREQELISKELYVPDGKEITYIGYSVKDPDKTAAIWAETFNGTVSDALIPGYQVEAKKVKFDSIEIFFSITNQSKRERPYVIGISPSKEKLLHLHGGMYQLY
ncbi:VOC family protein [Ferdinandcohnia sp. Marseille-Q9671]